jgi:archaemetzincin
VKALLTVVFGGLLLIGCSSGPGPSLRKKGIALQPMAFADNARLHFLQEELSAFYHCPVYVLPDMKMPASFLNTSKGERYSADSILRWLSHRRGDSVAILMGITRKDIFITEKDGSGKIKEPLSKYAVWGILGLGYTPGRAAIVSDARYYQTDASKYEHRLRTIAIHEIGHNMGLPHCKNRHCIMNDANEQISTIDSSGTNLCQPCEKKVIHLLQ